MKPTKLPLNVYLDICKDADSYANIACATYVVHGRERVEEKATQFHVRLLETFEHYGIEFVEENEK